MSQNIKETTLQITGMTCAACAVRIEKGLNKVEGVEAATVNLALERSSIKYDPAVTNLEALEKRVRDLGYDVVTEKTEFDITGMTCAACATRIEKGLNKLNGVSKANVNLALEKATVEYNPSSLSKNEIIQKVEALGYGAIVKEEVNQQETIDHRQREIEKQKGKFIFSTILSLPLLWAMVGHFSFTSFIYVP